MISYRNRISSFLTVFACTILMCATAAGQAPPEIKAKLGIETKHLAILASDPTIVAAVRAHNSAHPTLEAAAMTNDKWRSLSVLDPFVRVNAKSPLSEYLKSKKAGDETIAKVFVSGADGCKVGFDAKTEHWTHKGMPKHEVPMTGATWIGTVKVDDSTGLELIQVGMPVLEGGKPIGSIVFGLRVDKLR
jgi:hypothetical protein